MNIFQVLKNLFRAKPQQSTFVYCKCGNELVADAEKSFIADVYVIERNVVHYHCSNCGLDSYYDFDHPVPLKLPFTENDSIIADYYKFTRFGQSKG